jgi:hypothetical protein
MFGALSAKADITREAVGQGKCANSRPSVHARFQTFIIVAAR